MEKKKTITTISTAVDGITSLLSLKKKLKRKVYSNSGEYIGKIKDYMFLGVDVYGIVVKRLFRKVFVGSEFLINTDEDVQMLKIDPITMHLGKHVYDKNGKYLGRVKDLSQVYKKNDFSSLLVRKNIFSKSFEVTPKQISTIKKNIILNCSFEE